MASTVPALIDAARARFVALKLAAGGVAVQPQDTDKAALVGLAALSVVLLAARQGPVPHSQRNSSAESTT